jgi:hypothetical protein
MLYVSGTVGANGEGKPDDLDAQSNRANLTTSKTYYQQSDYRFDMKIFTELRNAQSVTIAYDGLNPTPPCSVISSPISTTQTRLIFCRQQTGSCEPEDERQLSRE